MRYGFTTLISNNSSCYRQEQDWRITMAVKLPLPHAAVTALSEKFGKNGQHHQLLINAQVPSIKYFELKDVSEALGTEKEYKAADAPDAFQQLGGAYGQTELKDRDQRYKGICIYLANAENGGERTETVKTLLVTLWNELTLAGAEFYYPEAPTGDINIAYVDPIGQELLTPFSYTSFKPHDNPHGILFEEHYNPENHPDPIDGISFTPVDLEGTQIQAPTVAHYKAAIEAENTHHEQALRALKKEITTLQPSTEEEKKESSAIETYIAARKDYMATIKRVMNRLPANRETSPKRKTGRQDGESTENYARRIQSLDEKNKRRVANLGTVLPEANEAQAKLIKKNAAFKNSEANIINFLQKKLSNLIQEGTNFGNKREDLLDLTGCWPNAISDDVLTSPFLSKQIEPYYAPLEPLVDQLLQNPYFKYYPKIPDKRELCDSEALKALKQLLSPEGLIQIGEVEQNQDKAKKLLDTLRKEKVSRIEVIQGLIADENQLSLEEKSQETNLRQQLVDLAAYRPNEAMVLYWRLAHIVQGKKAISRLEEQKNTAETIQQTRAKIDFFDRLKNEPTLYRNKRNAEFYRAKTNLSLDTASEFERGSKYHSSWGKRAGQSFGLILIAAAGALGGAGLAGDFSAAKPFRDIFTATFADIKTFESHTWMLMSVCAALFLAVAVGGFLWDRHHGQGERAVAHELRATAS